MKKIFLSILLYLGLIANSFAAITASVVDASSDTTNATTYSTSAPVTIHANRLVLAAVLTARDAGSSGGCTAASTGATWHETATKGHISYHTSGTPTRRLTILYTMVASDQTATITFSHGGVTQDGEAWIIVEFAGVDTSGVDGAGAIVQGQTSSGGSGATTITCTLGSSFADATNNVAYGAFGRSANGGITPGSGFTELGDNTFATPSNGVEVEWKTGEDLTVDASWSGGTDCGCDVYEIQAAAAGPGKKILNPLDEDELQ